MERSMSADRLRLGEHAEMSLKTDLGCLTECLRYQQGDPQRGKDTLLTIASLCSSSNEAQNFLRTSGGLSFIVNLLSTTGDDELKVAALYALGCATERNVFSQTRLCTEAMFKFLFCLLNNSHSSVKMKRTATFLIMCLVTNNGRGQTLVRKSNCMDALLQLFRKFPDIHLPYSPEYGSDEEDNQSCLELWVDVTSTLCGCVNNPQNDQNQLVCASSVPAALYIMSHTQCSKVTQLLCSFLSLLTANNAVNQDRINMLSGLEIIVVKLVSIVDAVITDPNKESIASASNMISMLNSVTAENENNLQAFSELEVVPQLLKLLSLDVIDQEFRLKIIVTLGCLVTTNGESQKQVVENDGLKLVLNAMMTSQDEECVKAATVILHSCVNAMSSLEADAPVQVDEKDELESQPDNDKQPAEKLDVPKNNSSATVPSDSVLNAKIEDLQKELELERKLRKSLEGNATIQSSSSEQDLSDASDQEEIRGINKDLGQNGAGHKSNTTSVSDSPNAEQKVGRYATPTEHVSSSTDMMKLQERMNTLEQKFQSIHGGLSQDEISKNMEITGSPSEETSGDTIQKHPVIHIQDNIRRCKKKVETVKKDERTTSGMKESQKRVESPKLLQKEVESLKFKIPTRPMRKCRPLQLVQVKGALDCKEGHSRKRCHQQRHCEMTPANVQRCSVRDLESKDKGNPEQHPGKKNVGACSSSESPSLHKRSQVDCELKNHRNVVSNSRGCTSGEGSSSKVKRKSVQTSSYTPNKVHCKDLHIDTRRDCDLESQGSMSDTISIADSVFSSLDAHLSFPVKPTNNCRITKPPLGAYMLTPVKRSQHKIMKAVDRFHPETDYNTDDTCEFAYKPHQPVSQGYHKNGPKTAPQQEKGTVPLKVDDQNQGVIAKLRKSPRVVVEKTLMKGQHMKMYTFEAAHQGRNLERNNSKTAASGCDPPLNAACARGSKNVEARRQFDMETQTKAKVYSKESGSSKKCYSIHFVKGKFQFKHLLGASLRSAGGKSVPESRTWKPFEPEMTCSGCTPPRGRPLLDSWSLVPTLRKASADLCENHSKLVTALAQYNRRKRTKLGL